MLAHVKKPWFLLLAVLALSVLVIGAAACGDDDDDDDSGGANAEQVEKTAVLAALTAFRQEGLHEIDDAAQVADEIEAGWSGAVERMHKVSAGTAWPADLKDMGDEFTAALEVAHDDLDAEDLAAFKGHIAEAHAIWHDLDHEGYNFISGDEHTAEGGHGDEPTDNPQEHNESTAAAAEH